MDLKWQLALLSMRTRRFFQKTGRKITINGSDTSGYDKSKVGVSMPHKMGHFAKGMQWDLRYQDYNEVPTNMALMAFLDSEGSSSKDRSRLCGTVAEEPKEGKITGKGPSFITADESQVLLKVPRKNNMYSVDMKNIILKESLTCLVAKATLHESMLWHRRLGKAAQSLIFTWVFFIATKDETSGILKSFITEVENLVNKKVKIIICDNGTEFKNRVMSEFCEKKGIKKEFSVARTPQQNGVVERRNRTLIEAARTTLADSKLPTTFWAEAVNTA
ncbi:ribonuclease H-like domain-containing protein [Tanacetum coccineum]